MEVIAEEEYYRVCIALAIGVKPYSEAKVQNADDNLTGDALYKKCVEECGGERFAKQLYEEIIEKRKNKKAKA